MAWFSRRSSATLPPEVEAALELADHDRVLAFALDSATRAYAVLTRFQLALVSSTGLVGWRRPWHEVKTAGWEPQTGTVSIAWTDTSRAAMLTIGQAQDWFADIFRERVQASVVTSQQIADADEGAQLLGQVTLRKDLATGELMEQVTLQRGIRRSSPGVEAAIATATAIVREQVGL